MGVAYQEDDRDVQTERAQSVKEEGEETDVVDLAHGDVREFPEQSDNAVHGRADRGEVVEGDQRVHLVLSRAQKGLDKVETDGLEENTTDLVEETDPDELDLAERGNHDTDDDRGHVHQDLHVGSCNAHNPAGKKYSNWRGSLEHLDEGNTEIKVGQVSADQTQAEEETDGDNSTQVHAASHLNRLAAIEQGGVASQQLSCNGGKSEMVGCEDDRIPCGRVSLYVNFSRQLTNAGLEKRTGGTYGILGYRESTC
jgi:hypothetical protein